MCVCFARAMNGPRDRLFFDCLSADIRVFPFTPLWSEELSEVWFSLLILLQFIHPRSEARWQS